MTYDNIRAAFRTAALGLMDWQDPPLISAREYRRAEGITGGGIYRPHGKETNYGRDEYADPFSMDEEGTL